MTQKFNNKINLGRLSFLLCIFVLTSLHSFSQEKKLLHGIITTTSVAVAASGVLVTTTSGQQTTTDSLGKFTIPASYMDTLFFYIGTIKSSPFPAAEITDWNNFELPIRDLQKSIAQANYIPKTLRFSDGTTLESVTVTTRDFHKDSLENRQAYGSTFGYSNPKFNPLSPISSMAGILNFKKKKTMKRMQRHLLFEEQQGYIDSRFNKSVIVNNIGRKVDINLVDGYMKKYRPTYDQMEYMENLDLLMYIRKTFDQYEKDVKSGKIAADSTNINKN
jgi:hypothetical protein